MLKFIYQDQRYASANNATKKTRAALFVILDFISSKLLESISWLLTATLAYLFLVIFYSNVVLFANITIKLKGLIQIVYALGLILSIAIFVLFAILIVAYLVASLFSLVWPKSTGAPSKTMDTIRKQKAYTFVKGFWDNITGIFTWKAPGGNRNLFIMILLSLFAFYHTWLKIPTANLKLLKYNYLPDFVMATSRELYKTTYPWITKAFGYVYDGYSYVWDFVAGHVGKLF